LGPTRIELGPT